MKKVVINIDNKAVFNEELSEKQTKKVLNKITKHYSKSKLEFKEGERYKLFAIKARGKKHRVVLGNPEMPELSDDDWKEIFEKTHKNTMLYEDFSNYQIKKYYFDNIMDSKEYFTATRRTVLFFVNKLLWIALFIFSCTITTGADALVLIPTVIGIKGMLDLALFASMTLGNGISDFKELIHEEPLFTTFLATVLEYPVYCISKVINNIIGDIKNNNFSIKEKLSKLGHKIGNAFKKIKNGLKQIYANKRLDDTIIDDVGIMLEKEEINPKVYVLNTEKSILPTVETIDSYMSYKSNYVFNAINKISNRDLRKSCFELYEQLIKQYEKYNKGKIILSDIQKRELMSDISNLENRVNQILLMQNDEDKIDELLNETKGHQYGIGTRQ